MLTGNGSYQVQAIGLPLIDGQMSISLIKALAAATEPLRVLLQILHLLSAPIGPFGHCPMPGPQALALPFRLSL